MAKLRVCSDIHGCIDNRQRFNDIPSFVELCQELDKNDYMVQLGDLGYDYTPLNKLDPNRVKIILGNHCDYSTAFNYPHMLGHYGMVELGPWKFFYVRGGFSIDKEMRIKYERITGQKTWFAEEELTYKQGKECIKLYEQLKPDVVFSHDAPDDIARAIGNPEILIAFGHRPDMVGRTQSILQSMIDIHPPALHIFAHFHKDWTMTYHGTKFVCMGERKYLDFDENWHIIGETSNAKS